MNYARALLAIVLVLFVTFLLSFADRAHGQSIDRLPTALELATGKVCFRSNAKGDYVAWYGDRDFPNVVACKKSVCSLVGSKRALAAFLSGPITKQRFDAAMTPYKEHPYKNQELRAVWLEDFVANCQHIR